MDPVAEEGAIRFAIAPYGLVTANGIEQLSKYPFGAGLALMDPVAVQYASLLHPTACSAMAIKVAVIDRIQHGACGSERELANSA